MAFNEKSKIILLFVESIQHIGNVKFEFD